MSAHVTSDDRWRWLRQVMRDTRLDRDALSVSLILGLHGDPDNAGTLAGAEFEGFGHRPFTAMDELLFAMAKDQAYSALEIRIVALAFCHFSMSGTTPAAGDVVDRLTRKVARDLDISPRRVGNALERAFPLLEGDAR